MAFQIPNVTITEAPIKHPIVDAEGFLTSGWVELIAGMTASLNGEWGPVYSPSFTINTTYSSYRVYGMQQGTTMSLTIEIDDIDATQGDTIDISTDLKFLSQPNVMNCHADISSTWQIQNGCYIEGKVITLPTVQADKVIITGNLIRKV